ncbi:hypothetical protein [Sphaerimonospora mesophila]|uniref:hypothetical protein n=1 Tax=Sphaerimonospora mesophila TaxID=37483 RepID=UPI000A432ADF
MAAVATKFRASSRLDSPLALAPIRTRNGGTSSWKSRKDLKPSISMRVITPPFLLSANR